MHHSAYSKYRMNQRRELNQSAARPITLASCSYA